MATPPILPLFVDDYLGDTQHLSCEENGAYMLLLMAAWRSADASLDNDDKKLARICRVGVRKWKTIRGALDEFWPVENGRIYNRKLRKERAYVDQKSATNRKNADARWNNQPPENKQGEGMRTQSERNAPHPHPHIADIPDGISAASEHAEDPGKILFELGHEVLDAHGYENDAARKRIIGNWRKQCGDDDRLIDTLARAQSIKPDHIVAWVNVAMHRREPNHGNRPRSQEPEYGTNNAFVAATIERKADRAAEKQRHPDRGAEDGSGARPLACSAADFDDGLD